MLWLDLFTDVCVVTLTVVGIVTCVRYVIDVWREG